MANKNNETKNDKKTPKKKITKQKKEKTPIKKIDKKITEKKPNKKIIIISYIVFLLIDIIMIIYFAKHNFVNYASIPGQEKILVSKTQKLFFGRNYITLIITLFFTIYTLLCNKYLLKIKNTKKLIISLIIFYLILNIALFYLFTIKIY